LGFADKKIIKENKYYPLIENTQSEQYQKLTQELRRGILVLAALSQLEEEKYGYSLISSLAEKGLDIEQGTLYPLLRRLEEQGLLKSEWNVEGSRPRRYYQISSEGSEILEELAADWRALVLVMEKLLANVAG
jgi:PadR family transcriptional regulator PadR